MQSAEAKILIVDDEQTNVLLLERILAKVPDYTVRSTGDSRRVIELTAEFEPDLLLLDLHMPYVDGFEVMERLRAGMPADDFFPILVLTADVTSQTRLKALSSGANDFLTKPFDRSEVLLRVANLLRLRDLHRQVQTQNERLEQMVQERTLELQRALTKLQETQSQVVQQERMHALGMMASGVAHDFNNALSIILGFGEIVLQDVLSRPESEGLGRHMQTIITAAMDAGEMVMRLREFYRPGGSVGPKLSIDLNALIAQSASLTQPRWKTQARAEGREIEVVVDTQEIPLIAGDAAELREGLTNLIFNAVDAMPKGGRITLRTRAASDAVLLEVADNGTGMNDDVRKRCLEPFFTTKGKQGTGLGLSMVYGIVERHGGTLEIESELGKGTVFRISLPAQGAQPNTSSPEAANVERLLNVLVVDDHPLLCEIYGEYLRSDWHNVETAHSGAEALERVKAAKFDLVLSDVAMPGMSGQQLAAEIQAVSPETRVILLTAFSNYRSEKASDHAGVAEILIKPVSRIDLRQAIVRAMTAGATA